MTEVSKTFSGSSILSSPAITITYEPNIMWFSHVFVVDTKIPEKQ